VTISGNSINHGIPLLVSSGMFCPEHLILQKIAGGDTEKLGEGLNDMETRMVAVPLRNFQR